MRASGRPSVAVFGLGGTIAMTQAPDGGVSPVLSASDLLTAVPGLNDLQAELRVRDFRNKPGASLDFTDLYELAAAIDEALNDGCARRGGDPGNGHDRGGRLRPRLAASHGCAGSGDGRDAQPDDGRTGRSRQYSRRDQGGR